MNRRLTTLACCLVATALSAQTPPVKTDFNGDGKSDIIWQKSTTSAATEFQMFNNSILAQGAVHTPLTNNWVIVAASDMNKDGNADLIWQNKLTGDVYFMYMAGLSPVYTATATIPASKKVYTEKNPDWQIVAAADFDRDGYTDLLWHNKTDGRVYTMYLNADGTVKSTSQIIYTEVKTEWAPVAAANFSKVANGNDIVWVNHATGQVYLMTLGVDGKPAATSKFIYTEPTLAWKVVAAADFNNDGNIDLLYWNNLTGQVYLLLLDASFNKISTDAGKGASGFIYTDSTTDWAPVAVGDYNGDGYNDILWRNKTSGATYLMFMDSARPGTVNSVDSAMIWTEPDTTWRPVAGLSTVSITPPVPSAAVGQPKTTTAIVNGADGSVVPHVTVTKGDAVTFASSLRGPVQSSAVAWEVWDTLATAKVLPALATISGPSTTTGLFTGLAAQDFLLKAVGVDDATKVASRYVTVVNPPVISSFTADSNSVTSGTPVAFSWGFTGATSATLTNDSDANVVDATSLVGVSITPAATATYTLTAKNAAGTSVTATNVITVTTTNVALDCTITTNPAGVTYNGATPPVLTGRYVTAGSIYTASVPAEVGVTYLWSLGSGSTGSITSALTGNQITYIAGASGNVVLNVTKTKAVLSNYGTLSVTIVDAPAVPAVDGTDFGALTNGIAAQVGPPATPNYVRAGVATTQAVSGTATRIPVLGYTGVASSVAPAVNGGASYNAVFTPSASGTVVATLAYKNLAGTVTPAASNFTRSYTIVAAPAPVVTASAFATLSTALANTVSVPAVTGSTYSWTVAAGTGNGTAPAAVYKTGTGTQTSSTAIFGSLAGAAGALIDVSCAQTNAAGLTVTSPVVTQTLCAAPAVPSSVAVANANVTVGFNSTFTATVSVAGTHTYDQYTYNYTITNGTLVGTPTVVGTLLTGTYTPTAAGPVTVSIAEVNAAGYASTASVVTANSTATAVARPAITGFGVVKNLITQGEAANFTFSFSGGSATLIDNGTATLAANIPAGTLTTAIATSGSVLAANASNAKHTVTLRVTNAASDFVDQTVLVDVAAVPAVASFVAALPAGGTAGAFGQTYTLTPTFTPSKATTPATYDAFDGQTVWITPGPINAPTTTTSYVVQPGQGSTSYKLNITNRAGNTYQYSTSGITTITINPVAVAAITSPVNVAAGASTTAITGGAVTGSPLVITQTFELVSDTTGGASISGSNLVLSASAVAGNVVLRSRSVTDPTKVSANYTVVVGSVISVNAPTLSANTCGVGESVTLSGSVASNAGDTSVTYYVVSGSGTISGTTLTATGAGAIVVGAKANANGTTVSAPVTLTASAIAVAAVTATGTPTAASSTLTLGGGTVTNANNAAKIYEVVSVSSGTATIVGSSLTISGVTPGGTVVVRAKSLANTSVISGTLTITTILVSTPTVPVKCGIGETVDITGSTATGDIGGTATSPTTVTYAVSTGPTFGSISGTSLTGLVAGTLKVQAKASIDGSTLSAETVGTVVAAITFTQAPVYPATVATTTLSQAISTVATVGGGAFNASKTYSMGAVVYTGAGAATWAIDSSGTITPTWTAGTNGTDTATFKVIATSYANNTITSQSSNIVWTR